MYVKIILSSLFENIKKYLVRNIFGDKFFAIFCARKQSSNTL